MATTQDITEILKASGYLAVLNLEHQLSDVDEIDKGIKLIEQPNNIGTHPFLVGLMFQAIKQQYPDIPNVECLVGFDADDTRGNNLVALNKKLANTTPPKLLFVPIGSGAHMTAMAVNVTIDASGKVKNEILYFNSLGNGIYPGAKKFIDACQEQKHFGESVALHIIPKNPLQLYPRDAYCGHWTAWFLRECLSQYNKDPNKTIGQLADHFNSIRTPNDLQMIGFIRQKNLIDLKQYKEMQEKRHAALSNMPLDTAKKKEMMKLDDGSLISYYINGINKIKGVNGQVDRLEIIFKPTASSIQKRQSFEALKRSLLQKGKSIDNVTANESEMAPFISVRFEGSEGTNTKPLTVVRVFQPRTQSEYWNSPLLQITNPISRQDIRNTVRGITLKIEDNEAISVDELSFGFKFFAKTIEDLNPRKLKDCGGITLDVGGLSGAMVQKVKEAYRLAGLPPANLIGTATPTAVRTVATTHAERKEIAAAPVERKATIAPTVRNTTAATIEQKGTIIPPERKLPVAQASDSTPKEASLNIEKQQFVLENADLRPIYGHKKANKTPGPIFAEKIKNYFDKLIDVKDTTSLFKRERYTVSSNPKQNEFSVTMQVSHPALSPVTFFNPNPQHRTITLTTNVKIENNKLNFGPATNENLFPALMSSIALQDPNPVIIKMQNIELLKQILIFCNKRELLGRIKLSKEADEKLQATSLDKPALEAYCAYVTSTLKVQNPKPHVINMQNPAQIGELLENFNNRDLLQYIKLGPTAEKAMSEAYLARRLAGSALGAYEMYKKSVSPSHAHDFKPK